MILIIHGNDLPSSRNFFMEKKNEAKNPVFLEGENLTYDIFFQANENKSLFGDKNSVFVENFFSKNKSNSAELKKIISYINSGKDLTVIFWEYQELSKAALSLIKNADLKNFSFPQNLFTFLDNVRPGNYQTVIKLFHELLATSELELIFFMITRQFRLLLGISDINSKNIDEVNRLFPWQLSKLKKQAAYFGKDKLIESYNRLFEIEVNHKTGKVPYSLEKSIDFFLLNL